VQDEGTVEFGINQPNTILYFELGHVKHATIALEPNAYEAP
jgi:hypothetical protein